MNEGLAILDANKTITYVNNRLCEMLAYAPGEILGRPTENLLDKINQRILEEQFEKRKKGGHEAYELTFTRKDGRELFVIISPRPIWGSDGQFEGSFAAVIDITRLKQTEKALQGRTYDLGIRIRELHCLFGISKLIENQDLAVEKLFQGIVDLLPPAWQYSQNTCARIMVQGREFRTANYRETTWKQAANITVHGDIEGFVEVYYLEQRPIRDEGPFLREERNLINAIAERLGRMIERKRAEEDIRRLSQELLQAQEIERQRLSCDLHDNLAQDLSTLRISLNTLFDDQLDISSDKRQRIAELSKMVQHSIMVVRDMSYDLHPASLEELGLVQTVRQYCDEFAEKYSLEIELFSVGLDGIEMDSDTEISLYRFIQEGLNNIRKHAEASHVIIRLSASFPYIMLRIEDNGKGFDVQKQLGAAFREKRMGLRSMEQRVVFLRGKMEIDSSPTRGTRILAKIPYTEKTNG
jgi:PAS domain S-box-containing protein